MPPHFEYSDLGSIVRVTSYREGAMKTVTIAHTRTVPTKQGDVLLIGKEVPFEDRKDITDTLKRAKDLGMVTVAEHMFVAKAGGIGEKVFEQNAEYFDAIELNGQARRKDNEKACKYAIQIGKPIIASSDSHTPHDVGRCSTSYDHGHFICYSSDEDFFNKLNAAIKHDKPEFTLRETPLPRVVSWVGILLYDVFVRRKTGLLPPTETKGKFEI